MSRPKQPMPSPVGTRPRWTRELNHLARQVAVRAETSTQAALLDLLHESNRDIYAETVAALGYDPLSPARRTRTRGTAAQKRSAKP